jgi:exodeoxyribonuclease V gamma subunit
MENGSEFNSSQCFFSNRMDRLATALAQQLFLKGRPFEKRLVIVPSDKIKEYLLFHFATHPDFKIAAGIQILSLNQGVMELLQLLIPKLNKRIPALLELGAIIHETIEELIQNEQSQLFEYVGNDVEKIAALAKSLAQLFLDYGVYGHQFLPEWLKKSGWKQAIWKRVFAVGSSWTYPLEILQSSSFSLSHIQIALFGFDFLPPLFLSFFSQLNASFYQLSPCALFWEDLCSEKERIQWQRILLKRKVGKETRAGFDRALKEDHPLLGNWGKLGREHLKGLNLFNIVSEEIYEEVISTPTQLTSLQRDLLELRLSPSSEPDCSIQIHSSVSLLREVEVLYDGLQTLMKKGEIEPREVVVLAPDIAAYAPHIHTVFGKRTSVFAYQIDDLPLKATSDAVQGFLHLIQIPKENFSLSSVMKLFSFHSFREKWGFSSEECAQLYRWFKKANIRTGLRSWEEGLERLVLGLAFDQDAPCWGAIAGVGLSDVELFNRFLTLFKRLEENLDGKKTLSEWFLFIETLFTTYFDTSLEQEPFLEEVKRLERSLRSLQRVDWTFPVVEKYLKSIANKPGSRHRAPHLQAITFRTFKEGSVTPARILWCLGMDENAFPKREIPSSLSEIERDYVPSSADRDRALFLQAVLLAQDHLCFSYVRIHPEDRKEQALSLLIEELIAYTGVPLKVDHPPLPFDAFYFDPHSPVKKWQKEDFDAACAYYGEKKALPPLSFNTTPSPLEVADVKQLRSLARNPIQFYFNDVLKIYLKESEEEEKGEFLLTALERSSLRKSATGGSLSHTLQRADQEGKLPRGLLKELAIHSVKEEVADVMDCYQAYEVNPEEIFSVEFSLHCKEAVRRENGDWILPALRVPMGEGRTIPLVGALSDLSPRGILFHGKKCLEDLLKAWPLVLIFLSVRESLGIHTSSLILTKDRKCLEVGSLHPLLLLADYLKYMELAQRSLSPLLPKWGSALLLKGKEEFAQAVKSSLNGTFTSYSDEYLQWLKRRGMLHATDDLFEKWAPISRTLFAPLISIWEERRATI